MCYMVYICNINNKISCNCIIDEKNNPHKVSNTFIMLILKTH